MAASRSLSLTRNSSSPCITVLPSAKAAATARMGYSSIMEGARSAGTSTPFSCEWRTIRSPISSPPLMRRLVMSMSRAHLQQGLDQADAAGIEQDGGQRDLRARHDQRRHQRKGGRGRIARHFHGAAVQAGAALRRAMISPPSASGVDGDVARRKPPASFRYDRGSARSG